MSFSSKKKKKKKKTHTHTQKQNKTKSNYTEMNRIGLKWTKVDPMDQIGSHKPKWTYQTELN